VGCQKEVTSRDQVIFVDEATEHIPTADVLQGGQNSPGRPRPWFGLEEAEGSVRTMGVVMVSSRLNPAPFPTSPDR